MKELLLFFLLVFPVLAIGQNELTDSLRYSQHQKCVFQGTRKMSMDDLFVRTRPYPKTFELIESARDCNFYATVFATAGAIPLGYVLVNKLVTNTFNWPSFATGIGLIGVAIPLNIRYKKQLQRAVLSFNEEVSTSTHFHSNVQLNLCVNARGIGFSITF